jgi:hypothetical protein
MAYVKEIKCTCLECKNIWFYGKEILKDEDALIMQQNLNKEKQQRACSDVMACTSCTGCGIPLIIALFIKPKKQTKYNISHCPNCKSAAVRQETIIHNV